VNEHSIRKLQEEIRGAMKTITEKETRFLGASGITVPPMGVGTAHWGASIHGYGRTYTREDIYGAYRACLDAGLNFIDTAEVYGKGESERLLGEFRKQDGRPIMIATKYWNPSSVALRIPLPASGLLPALDASLKD
jgi:aryl-alcohol dehydrogenase-like predicted oxidoreductase